jgi:ubiquinone/menaquinone biosynthesis C-methylase UbiE
MNTSKFYDEWSVSYDTDHNRTRDLDEKVMREVLGGMSFSSILELGCGTGKNTLFLSVIGDDVVAFDFSPKMIEIAKTKVSAKNVRFFPKDITTRWSREDASVDLIVCNLVLEHVENLENIFVEAQRTLRSSGSFFISELHPFRQYQGVKANFKRPEEAGSQSTYLNVEASGAPSAKTASYESEAFIHHISDFLGAARTNGLVLDELNEWWHEEDAGGPPRLVTFLFKKS